MDVSNGNVYPSIGEAVAAGAKYTNLVEVSGPPEAVEALSEAVRLRVARDRAHRKVARKSRRANRRSS